MTSHGHVTNPLIPGVTSDVNKYGGGVNDLLPPLLNMQITYLICKGPN